MFFSLFFVFYCLKIKIMLDNYSTTFSGYHLIGNTNLTCRSYPLKKGSCFNSYFVQQNVRSPACNPAVFVGAQIRPLRVFSSKNSRFSSWLLQFVVLQAPSLLSSRAMKPAMKPPVTFVRKAKAASGSLGFQRWLRTGCVVFGPGSSS